LVGHIINQLVLQSPYIALSRSFEVAESYAKYYGLTFPSAGHPAFVYELELDASLVTLIDPVADIANAAGTPFTPVSYQHDGGPDLISGLVGFARFLARPIRLPADSSTGRPPMISSDLLAILMALRDAEVLANGTIPARCVINRYEVF
jgi:hypothetical protein